jgi:hypothetical protein
VLSSPVQPTPDGFTLQARLHRFGREAVVCIESG